MSYEIHNGDCLVVLPTLPADSVDIVIGSPPYEDARTYGIEFDLSGQAWVDWMVEVFRQCQRVCRGLVCMVVEGRTEDFCWSATPALLMADLHRAGFNLRKPPIYRRVGIPGSGGPDWLRNDYEFCVCTARPGKLPWSDNTACGHPPKWAPGGEMSHRVSDGKRVNQWGPTGSKKGGGKRFRNGEETEGGGDRPSHVVTYRNKNGERNTSDAYAPPALANPGNVISCKVGGGVMGGKLAHENEAPYPERIPEFFISSFCPPETGIVLDPFLGSGTTLAVAKRLRRNGIGIDIRESQCDLARRRLDQETPMLEGFV